MLFATHICYNLHLEALYVCFFAWFSQNLSSIEEPDCSVFKYPSLQAALMCKYPWSVSFKHFNKIENMNP